MFAQRLCSDWYGNVAVFAQADPSRTETFTTAAARTLLIETLTVSGAAPSLTIRTLAACPSADTAAETSPALTLRLEQPEPSVKLALCGCQLSLIMACTCAGGCSQVALGR